MNLSLTSAPVLERVPDVPGPEESALERVSDAPEIEVLACALGPGMGLLLAE